MHLGENMSAVAIPGRVLTAPKGVIQGPLPGERVTVILNFGIIDILQEYNIVKQLEHTWKVRTCACGDITLCCADAPRSPADCCAAATQHLVGRPHDICEPVPGVHVGHIFVRFSSRGTAAGEVNGAALWFHVRDVKKKFRSCVARRSGSRSVSYASAITRKRCSATFCSSGVAVAHLSGCHFDASLRYWRVKSRCVADIPTPSTW